MWVAWQHSSSGSPDIRTILGAYILWPPHTNLTRVKKKITVKFIPKAVKVFSLLPCLFLALLTPSSPLLHRHWSSSSNGDKIAWPSPSSFSSLSYPCSLLSSPPRSTILTVLISLSCALSVRECLTLCNYVSNYVGYYFVITLHYFVITLLGLTLPIVTIYILLIIINERHKIDFLYGNTSLISSNLPLSSLQLPPLSSPKGAASYSLEPPTFAQAPLSCVAHYCHTMSSFPAISSSIVVSSAAAAASNSAKPNFHSALAVTNIKNRSPLCARNGEGSLCHVGWIVWDSCLFPQGCRPHHSSTWKREAFFHWR